MITGLQQLTAIPAGQLPPADAFANGTSIRVATPAGVTHIQVTPAGYVLTDDFDDIPAGTPITFDRDGSICARVIERPSPMGGFLNKAGPVRTSVTPKIDLTAAVAEVEVAAALASWHGRAARKVIPMPVPPAPAPSFSPSTSPPGRPGRAIDLD